MKKTVSVFLALLLLCTMTTTAFAQNYSSTGWLVTFNGDQMVSNFNSNTIATEISKVEPGDSITVSVTLKNTSSDSTEWYMLNEVLKSLEDSKNSPRGGAYDYELTYQGPSESKTFFNSSGVGGENGDIKNATGNLKDYFYVGNLKTGQTGVVTLKVTIDGEADGNAYQDTLAQFKMQFAVEKTTSDGKKKEYSPKTGEVLHIALWLVVFLGSLAVIIAILRAKKKVQEEDKKK